MCEAGKYVRENKRKTEQGPSDIFKIYQAWKDFIVTQKITYCYKCFFQLEFGFVH